MRPRVVSGALLLTLLIVTAPAGAHYIGLIYYPPAVDNEGSLYVSGTDGILYALHADGTPRWTYNTSQELTTRAIADEGTVYVATRRAGIVAVSQNGSPAWTTRLEIPGESVRVNALSVGDERVFALTRWGIHALDRETGQEEWRFVPGERMTGVAIANTTVYLTTASGDEGTLYAVTAQGNRLWTRTYPESVDNLAASSDTVYFETGGRLFALSSGGNRRWTVRTGPLWSPPAIGDSRLVVGTFDGRVLEVRAGRITWQYTVGEPIAPTIGPDGRIYATTREEVVAVEDGDQVWRTQIGATVLQSPTVTDDRVYVGTQLNRTYALSTNGSIVWIDRYATPFGFGQVLPDGVSPPSVLGTAVGTPTRVIQKHHAPDAGTGAPETPSSKPTPLVGFGVPLAVVAVVIAVSIRYYHRSEQ